jgi:multidrug efflux pump subunit AcrB
MTEQTPNNESEQPQEEQPTHVHGLGLAGNLARAFIHSPLSPLFLLACLGVGLLGLFITPRQEDPQISVPMVDIMIRFTGASAEEVAALAIDPLQRIMSEIPGVDHVYSVSRHGQGIVTVQFDVGEELEPSLVKLYDKLESNQDKIPPGVDPPLVKPKGVDDVPVVTLTLWSNEVDDPTLRLISLDVLQALSEVENTSQGFIVGGHSEEIKVEVLPEKLSGFGISLDQLAQTIRTANTERGLGNVEALDQSYRVYSGSFLTTPEDVEALIVAIQGGSPVYVRDVANVFEGPSDTKHLVNYFTAAAYELDTPLADGAPAVTIAIAKKKGSNGVTVAKDILRKVEDLKGRLIPDNVYVAVTRNYGETARDKVNDLIKKLFIATGVVVALVWLALGLRPAIVVLIVIPVVILVTVFSAYVMGYTIDRVSLFALIFAIGILVDDAIVVVENIYRRWLLVGTSDTDTAVDAVREVGNPTILATFTVVAALLPMGFVRGMMGPYMEPIPALGSVAMIFSLMAAFMFTPWLTMRVKPPMRSLEKMEDREHRQAERVEVFYRRTIVPLISSRAKGVAFLVAIIAAFFVSISLFYLTWVPVKMLPLDNKPEFNVVVNYPDGTALPVTANMVYRLTDAIRQVPEVTAVQTYVGTASPFNFNGLVRHYYLRSSPWEGDIQVQLLDKHDRDRSSHEIAVDVRARLQEIIAGTPARVQVVEMPPGPPVLQSVVAEVYGPSAETRREVADDLTAMFAEATYVTDVDNLMQQPYEIWRFEVDTEKAVRRGISTDTINRTLDMALGDFKLGDVKRGPRLEPTYLVVQLPFAMRGELARLGEIPVPSQMGITVPLNELGRFVRGYQDPMIFAKDLRPVEFVTGETQGRLAAPLYGMLEVEDMLEDYVSPDGVKVEGYYTGPPPNDTVSAFEWGGEWTVTYETFRDMGLAFGAALILIYMLVVWEFGNFILPAVVMAPIPLTLIGIVPGHWLLGAEFTATSMIGFIALAGIIVRNSILLVDFTKTEVEEGKPVSEAVIQACRARTRPIMITAFALVGGSFVILTDPIFKGMAISLLFGVLVSTLLTLLVIPLGCISARRGFAPHHLAISGDVELGALPHDPLLDGSASERAAAARRETAQSESAPASKGKTLLRWVGRVSYYLWMYLVALVVSFGQFLKDLSKVRLRKRRVSHGPVPAAAGVPGGVTAEPARESAKNAGAAARTAVSPTSIRDEAAAAEKAAAERAAAETAAAEKAAAEKAAAEKAAAEKAAAEKAAAEKAAAEKAAAEKAAAERAAAERAAAERAAAEKAAAEKAAAEKAAAEKAAAEKAAAEKAAAEKAAAEKAAAEKAAAEKAAAEKAAAEKPPSTKPAKKSAAKKGAAKKAKAKKGPAKKRSSKASSARTDTGKGPGPEPEERLAIPTDQSTAGRMVADESPASEEDAEVPMPPQGRGRRLRRGIRLKDDLEDF